MLHVATSLIFAKIISLHASLCQLNGAGDLAPTLFALPEISMQTRHGVTVRYEPVKQVV